MSWHNNEHDGLPKGHPSCFVHDCCEVVDTPKIEGRRARCAYFGQQVKTGSYNGNACSTCIDGGICACEQDSRINLWFFVSKPDQEFDEYYCACHGAD